MDKLSKGFGIAKQWGMEKVGKAKATVESEDFQNMVKAFQANKTELTQLDKALKALLHANEVVKNAEADFSVSLQNSCVATHGTKLEGDVTQLVTSFLPVLNGMQSDRKTYNDALAGLTSAVEKLLATEVANGEKLLKKLDTARLDHDAKLSKVQSLKEAKNPKPEEVKIAEAASASATKDYEAVKEAVAKQSQELAASKSALFAEKLPIYTRALASFYSDALACVQKGGVRDEMKSAGAAVSSMMASSPASPMGSTPSAPMGSTPST